MTDKCGQVWSITLPWEKYFNATERGASASLFFLAFSAIRKLLLLEVHEELFSSKESAAPPDSERLDSFDIVDKPKRLPFGFPTFSQPQPNEFKQISNPSRDRLRRRACTPQGHVVRPVNNDLWCMIYCVWVSFFLSPFKTLSHICDAHLMPIEPRLPRFLEIRNKNTKWD